MPNHPRLCSLLLGGPPSKAEKYIYDGSALPFAFRYRSFVQQISRLRFALSNYKIPRSRTSAYLGYDYYTARWQIEIVH